MPLPTADDPFTRIEAGEAKPNIHQPIARPDLPPLAECPNEDLAEGLRRRGYRVISDDDAAAAIAAARAFLIDQLPGRIVGKLCDALDKDERRLLYAAVALYGSRERGVAIERLRLRMEAA
ncbi:MAG TPA: hypothetical protein VFA12_20565 [Stellaceae bacterium]|nr:hypothetical protein [Stellaceae bacterium]